MSKQIQLNAIDMTVATTQAGLAIGAIDVAMEKWDNQGEKSIAIEAFAQQFYEMERAMSLYQKLLQQDVSAVNDLVREFFIAECNLARFWGQK